MRYIKTTAATAMGFSLIIAAFLAAVPMARHLASAWWNDPERLPALPENPQVHYQEGAYLHARMVAGLLPAAIVRVEEIHGRRFAYPVTVGVYVAWEAADPLGNPSASGVHFLRHVILWPVLVSIQGQRLPAILTHELSHAHLQSWISVLNFYRLPNWFKEGLAVMVSGGGGAEGISELQAREAIRRGDHIAIESAGSLLGPAGLRFVQPPEKPETPARIQMAYRQAGLFVGFLRDADPVGFASMMNAVLDGRPLAEAVTTGYATDLHTLWLRFVRQNEH